MLTVISHEDVVRVAKEILPGLTDDHIYVAGPDPSAGWCVTVRLKGAIEFVIFCAADALSAVGRENICVKVQPARLKSVDELRVFLKDYRDSLARNLEDMLAVIHGGPVRVLLAAAKPGS